MMINKTSWLYGKKMQFFAYFVVFFLFFLLLQSQISFFVGRDDPYYHAKHSALMAENKDIFLVRPWINFQFLSYAPADPWWGYHVLGAFFIYFFGTVLGMKMLASILAALVVAVFMLIIQDYGFNRPFIWLAPLLFASPFFLYRMLLTRPLVVSMALTPLAFWMMLRKKHIWLGVLAFVFTLLYNLSPLLLFSATLFIITGYVKDKTIDFKPLIASGAGVLFGILAHPHSLNYVFVMFVHLFRVISLRMEGVNLGIGAEVQTIDFFTTLASNLLVIGSFILAASLYLALKEVRDKADENGGLFLFLASLFWMTVTFFIPRGIEYWVPFNWLFVALTFISFAKSPHYETIYKKLNQKIRLNLVGYFVYFFIIFTFIVNFYMLSGYVFNKNDQDFNNDFADAAAWLKTNTAKGSTIFYDDWSYWPIMFYYNDQNRYIAGFDPTFLYEYDHRLFWIWRNIAKNGQYCDKMSDCQDLGDSAEANLISHSIREDFQSGYVLIYNDKNSKLLKLLQGQKRNFELMFTNKEVSIYKAV